MTESKIAAELIVAVREVVYDSKCRYIDHVIAIPLGDVEIGECINSTKNIWKFSRAEICSLLQNGYKFTMQADSAQPNNRLDQIMYPDNCAERQCTYEFILYDNADTGCLCISAFKHCQGDGVEQRIAKR